MRIKMVVIQSLKVSCSQCIYDSREASKSVSSHHPEVEMNSLNNHSGRHWRQPTAALYQHRMQMWLLVQKLSIYAHCSYMRISFLSSFLRWTMNINPLNDHCQRLWSIVQNADVQRAKCKFWSTWFQLNHSYPPPLLFHPTPPDHGTGHGPEHGGHGPDHDGGAMLCMCKIEVGQWEVSTEREKTRRFGLKGRFNYG